MDAVDKLKQDLCKFARTKLNANYADCVSLMKIVDKYDFDDGEVYGVKLNCLTTHNKVLAIRYNSKWHTSEEVNEMVKAMNKAIKDNTTSVVCIPDDATIRCMTLESFQQFIGKLCEIYQSSEQYSHDRWISMDGQDGFAYGIDLSRYYPPFRTSMVGAGLLNRPLWMGYST